MRLLEMTIHWRRSQHRRILAQMHSNISKAIQEIDLAVANGALRDNPHARMQLVNRLEQWATELGYQVTIKFARVGDLYEFQNGALRANRVLRVMQVDGTEPEDYVYFEDGTCSKQRYMAEVRRISGKES